MNTSEDCPGTRQGQEAIFIGFSGSVFLVGRVENINNKKARNSRDNSRKSYLGFGSFEGFCSPTIGESS